MIQAAMAVRISAGSNFCSSSALPYFRSKWSLEDVNGGSHASSSCRLFHFSGFERNKIRKLSNSSVTRKSHLVKNQVRASAEPLGPASDPGKQNARTQYHPSEDFSKSAAENGADVRLTAAETTRTLIEVNSKATLMFSSFVIDEVGENVFWPELPYVIDEHGNIYFQLKSGEETMQNLTSENNYVQVLIGLDTTDLINEIDLSGPSEVDFGIEELDDEGSDDEEDDDEDDDDDDDDDEEYDTDWAAVLDDESDSDETVGDWAKLETMRSSHPLYFAKKISEVASDDPIDCMEQPPASLVIQGVLRPAFSEEHSVIQKHLSSRQPRNFDGIDVGKNEEKNLELHDKVNGYGHDMGQSDDNSIQAEDSDEDTSTNGSTFYRLEMVKIQLFTGHTHPALVEVEDYMKAQPDAIANSAAKIITRVKAGGEKATQALKSLCWRCKGIQVEEAILISVDSLGFDLRVCSGTQVQTLRFGFNTRATSEYSAERQLNELVFPRTQSKSQKTKQTYQNEC